MNSLVLKAKGLGYRMSTALFLGLLSIRQAFAALPEQPLPEGVSEDAGINELVKGHLRDGAVIGGLALATVAFIVVAINAVKTFSAVQEGKKTWADFAAVVVVGALLLVVCIWLLNQSAEVFEGEVGSGGGTGGGGGGGQGQ